jgi:hypothetical protein
MRNPKTLVTVSILALAGIACGSKSGISHGQDGAPDSARETGGISGSGGKTTGVGGGSGEVGAGGIATGAGGISGTGGTVTGGSGGRGGTGGVLGSGGSGTGGTAKDASPNDGPKDSVPDAPAQTDDGPAQPDSAQVCPDHLPVLPIYPYTPESCSMEVAASKLQCTYTAPPLGADGGPTCDQTYFCQCVSGQGGPPTCTWQITSTVCPDAGAPPADASRSDSGASDAASNALCSGKVCATGDSCCGPAECGRCVNALSGAYCPSDCSTMYCGPSGGACAAGEICVDVTVSAGPTIGSATAKCVTNPCGAQTLACSCAGTVCSDIDPQTTCSQVDSASGLLRCIGGNKCAAPDTPIATPQGNRAIADLKPGDWVFSVHDGALIAVPLLQVVRRPAVGHHVVHLVTAKGAVLDISAPHPTADGRRFDDLKVGDSLDGDRILVREVVPYPHAFTYDILPASSTGTYVAAGVLIGSTLK